MNYDYIDRAKAAMHDGNWRKATWELFGPSDCDFICDKASRVNLLSWAENERNSGYGLRCEVLEYWASQRNLYHVFLTINLPNGEDLEKTSSVESISDAVEAAMMDYPEFTSLILTITKQGA